MKTSTLLTVTALAIAVAAGSALAGQKSGEALYKEKCASCHPNGGNVMNPKETLKGLKNQNAILKQIRKGGGGMPAFDKKSLSDAEAKAIATDVITTFKK